MEIVVPHTITYETTSVSSVSDVVASLRASEEIFRHAAIFLAACSPDFSLDTTRVSIRNISQESPLREVLTLAMIGAFQGQVEHTVPSILSRMIGVPISERYDSIIAMAFILALVYGADWIYTSVSKGAFSRRLRWHLEEVSHDISQETGISPERVKELFASRLGERRLSRLGRSAARFFLPSKNQRNVPVVVGQRTLDSETVAEVPSSAQIGSIEEPDQIRNLEDVEIELHAQDIDRARRGWAAVIPSISSKRVRMELLPPVKPDDLYTKTKIIGDGILLMERKDDGTTEPHIFHLTRIQD